jgi:hypothetical protein
MKIGIVQTSNIQAKIEEALSNANDIKDNHVTFFIQEHALPRVIEFLKEKNISKINIQNESVFIIKHMRISFEIIDYYV